MTASGVTAAASTMHYSFTWRTCASLSPPQTEQTVCVLYRESYVAAADNVNTNRCIHQHVPPRLSTYLLDKLSGWRFGVVVESFVARTKVLYVEPGWLHGTTPPRYATKPTRSTQPCIPLGSLNRVPAVWLAGIKEGISPLSDGR